MAAVTHNLSWHKLRSALDSSFITIKREKEVRCYVVSHPDMLDLVEGIGKATRQTFGPDASLVLDVYQDPEVDDPYLVLYVRLGTYAADTLTRIRSISDPFEIDLCNASGSILVTTDFRPLR